MQANSIGEGCIAPRRGVVEAPAGQSGQPLRQSTYGSVVAESHRHAFEAPAAIDPNGIGSVDEDIGHRGVMEERLQRAGADEFTPQRLDHVEQCAVSEHLTLGP